MNQPNARDRILKAAVRIFAEKSFAGSRIEEISREAGVPKSLIYYHFKSKEDILEILVSDFIREYLEILAERPVETHREKAEALGDRMRNDYYGFGRKNADLARVILIESLKKSTSQPILYKILDAMIQKDRELSPDMEYDLQERRIAEFFTSFIPNYAFLCFGESWTAYYGIEEKQFNELYGKVYGETHGAYHRNHK